MKKIGFVGIGLIALAVLLGLQNPTSFYQGWLLAFLFWFAIPMGSLAFRFIHYLTWGNWGKALNLYLESAIRTIPLMAVLFIPIAIGMKYIYPWVNPSHEVAHFLTGFKGAYLTAPGFLIRAAICFSVWLFFLFILSRVEKKKDNWQEAPGGLQGFSGIALLTFVITMTVAMIDWGMSLKPEWYSTMWPVMFMIGQGLSALSFGIISIVYFYPAEHRDKVPVTVFHDLGKLMLAFTMLWTYMNLGQFLIIWGANISEEVTWYLDRYKNGWQYGAYAMLFLQFVLPFLILLSQDLKRNPKKLASVAMFIFAARLTDFFWTVKPAYAPSFGITIYEILLFAGFGAVWFAFFTLQKEKMSRVV